MLCLPTGHEAPDSTQERPVRADKFTIRGYLSKGMNALGKVSQGARTYQGDVPFPMKQHAQSLTGPADALATGG